ncbi:DUF4352 domain-containing protein [Nakamurella sp. A5-74]|uniref:DUF4352 domain-containing protein n=1 Tax=Nakamurella sp. A5-74 TaxID=3158264 RepID=A0AAU8DL20_9ACTN
MRKYIGAVLAAGLLVAGCGASSSNTPVAVVPSGPTVGVVGQATTYSSGQGTAAITVHSFAWKKSSGDTSGVGSAAKNGSYLVADVTVEGLTGSVSVNPLYLSARDEEGRSAGDFGAELGSFRPSLDSGTVTPGRKMRGLVAWDVDPTLGWEVELLSVRDAVLVSWKAPNPPA